MSRMTAGNATWQHPAPGARFAATLDYLGERTDPIAAPLGGTPSLRAEATNFLRVFRALLAHKPVVLDSSTGRFNVELLAAAAAALIPRRRRPVVMMVGEMWQRDGGLRGRLEYVIVHLAQRVIDRFVVYSSEELTLFPQLWNVPAAKIRFAPFFSTIEHAHKVEPAQRAGGYVFAGGNPFRDYAGLLEVARAMPETTFVLATNQLDGREDLPANVEAGLVSHAEFLSLLAGADAVVTPIRAGLTRAVGQQTYLNAMRSGKATIVSDALAVRDHIDDGETGLIVEGTVASYVAALKQVLGPVGATERARLGGNASVSAQNFTIEGHVEQLLVVLDDAIAERSGTPNA
jgi:glycosyltransferase involved in cell wall biosynthesis